MQLISRIARNISGLLGLNCDLIEAIALGHDVGHTPFGPGEHFLNKVLPRKPVFTSTTTSIPCACSTNWPTGKRGLQTLDGVLCHNGEFAQQVLRMGHTATFSQLDELNGKPATPTSPPSRRCDRPHWKDASYA